MDPERDHDLKRDRRDNLTQRGPPLPLHHPRASEEEERGRDGYHTQTQKGPSLPLHHPKESEEEERGRDGYHRRLVGPEMG